MRIIIILAVFLFEVCLLAMQPSYDLVKLSAEQQDPTNSVPAEERVYICPDYRDCFIQRYQDGLTIRQLIDRTKFKNTLVEVSVFRPFTNIPTSFVIYKDRVVVTYSPSLTNNPTHEPVSPIGRVYNAVVSPTNNPVFKLRARDAILFENMSGTRVY